ncbi:endo-N-acetyl-beta-D-glucosaminidase precursor [Podospora appendiculata]|uniref:Endo-N-acetyl-beta-D-glucosaminidase n=1 Tax=Podospora appendiculata TaxID=314037 RepID=A0AAE0XAF6_9PEZI|nr:endo-N-acetyl-beta-D-glucosaminidase precursor [Podospora appendiculata]
MMKSTALRVAALLCALAIAAAAPVESPESQKKYEVPADSEVPRLIIYYQTTHDASTQRPISMLPLITEKNIALTHLIVCSLHIDPAGSVLRLNDYPVNHSHFYTLWNETAVLQRTQVKVFGMIGGAAAGSFSTATLDGSDKTFATYYPQLRNAISRYKLEGIDLDVEQSMSQAGITRLIRRLRQDFGPDFSITLAPVATALRGGPNLSGFSYTELEKTFGAEIDFYNAQFYNGFGDMDSPAPYEDVIKHGWSPLQIVAGQLTSPQNGGDFTSTARLNATVHALVSRYGNIGGIFGWEYFNSAPGGTAKPWAWAQDMTSIMRSNGLPKLAITTAVATRLVAAWRDTILGSIGAPSGNQSQVNTVVPASVLEPDVNYMAMVNA